MDTEHVRHFANTLLEVEAAGSDATARHRRERPAASSSCGTPHRRSPRSQGRGGRPTTPSPNTSTTSCLSEDPAPPATPAPPVPCAASAPRRKYAARGSRLSGSLNFLESADSIIQSTAACGRYASPSRSTQQSSSGAGPPMRSISPSEKVAAGNQRPFTITRRICPWSKGHQSAMSVIGILPHARGRVVYGSCRNRPCDAQPRECVSQRWCHSVSSLNYEPNRLGSQLVSRFSITQAAIIGTSTPSREISCRLIQSPRFVHKSVHKLAEHGSTARAYPSPRDLPILSAMRCPRSRFGRERERAHTGWPTCVGASDESPKSMHTSTTPTGHRCATFRSHGKSHC